MNMKSLTKIVLLGTLSLSLTACGHMSTRDKSTIGGAAIGGAAGAIMTGGSAWGTVGGAAVGGVIGNQVGKQSARENSASGYGLSYLSFDNLSLNYAKHWVLIAFGTNN